MTVANVTIYTTTTARGIDPLRWRGIDAVTSTSTNTTATAEAVMVIRMIEGGEGIRRGNTGIIGHRSWPTDH